MIPKLCVLCNSESINIQTVPKRCIHKVNIPYYNVYTSFWAGVWKLGGIRRGWEKGICPPCRDNEDAKHILLRCPETKKRRMQFVNKNGCA
jgi:hypothetical protein